MDQLSLKKLKIRKPHNCWGCAEEFQPSTEMTKSVAVDQGEFSSSYWCEDCETIMNNLEHWEKEDGIKYGEFNDSDYDDYRGKK